MRDFREVLDSLAAVLVGFLWAVFYPLSDFVEMVQTSSPPVLVFKVFGLVAAFILTGVVGITVSRIGYNKLAERSAGGE